MPRRTQDRCVTLSLSAPVSVHARLNRLLETFARKGYRGASVNVLARDLLLATLKTQEEALNLPAYVPPPVFCAEPVFVPGTAGHLRELSTHGGDDLTPPGVTDLARSGVIHVEPGLDANDDLSAVMAELKASATPAVLFRAEDLFPKAP